MSLKPGLFAWVLAGGFLVGGLLFAVASPSTRLLGLIWIGTAVCVLALFGSQAYREYRARPLRRTGIPGVALIQSMTGTGTAPM